MERIAVNTIKAGLVGAALLLPTAASSGPIPTAIVTADVARFYQVYDAAAGHPTAEQLQHDYVDLGTPAFRQFAIDRKITGATLAAAIAKTPATFESARGCARVLPAVGGRLASAFARLRAVYPAAKFPPVTIVIGRGATGGTTNAAGVLIGLETLCGARYMDPDLTARFVHLIAHEYAHVQQPAAQSDPVSPTVLFASLIEGGAELVGEETSGDVGNYQLKVWTRGHEREIEERFTVQKESTDLKDWLWAGPGTPEHPGDLGYWVGYRIAKAYLLNAPDRCRALRAHYDAGPSRHLYAQRLDTGNVSESRAGRYTETMSGDQLGGVRDDGRRQQFVHHNLLICINTTLNLFVFIAA